MLCISVAPVSRSLAKADLLNAANQCDLVELCVDHFLKEPDVGDLVKGIPKPILIACRRAQDGGKFDGTDDERMLLLRQAIVAGPEYIELDLEAAAKVPRFGKVKRLIDVTSLSGPPDNLDAIFEEAATVHADAIKFAWPTPTFEAAWPLIKLLSQKRSLPVVGLGIGRASLTLALLGKMLEAPWSYAALEKGLESVPGQPTVADLKESYAWDEIGPKTRFVGLVGPLERQTPVTARLLNAAFRATDDRHRCLPLPVQSFDRLLTRLEGLKINSLLVAPNLAVEAARNATKREGSAEPTGYADLMLRQPDGWTAYNTVWRKALAATEERIGKKSADDHPLARRNVLVVGSGGMAPALIYGIQKKSGIVSVTGPDEKAAQQLAQKFNVRHVPFHALYDTLADVVVIADGAIKMGHQKTEINAGYFRSTMLVMDLCSMPYDSEVLEEVRARGCKVVEPRDAFRDWVAAQFESVCGKKFPTEVFDDALGTSP
ncbi:MAG TPA: type I 3-dehydroquinate dehydratase [Planctomycetaceae bacterium]|jgi:3-dehydroquinate dehydratase/shikimate dehydrogenase|nr:type I 3-dehydroquinate dehydratase [Planctomycetaceae bacterium]